MNTDIYIEIDREQATRATLFRKSFALHLQHIDMKSHNKWLKKTKRWRDKCLHRMFSKPWSIDKKVYIASINKK